MTGLHYHVPVLAEEIVTALVHGADGVTHGLYVDCTVGDGGHAEALLIASSPGGCVVGFDVDALAIARAQERLRPYRDRVQLVHRSYTKLAEVLEAQDVEGVDGIVADFGFSSMQIDTPERGLSFQQPGPLDMRMNAQDGVTAEELLRTGTEQELAYWFHAYGEERYSRRIARVLCERRQTESIATTTQLASLIRSATPRGKGRVKIDPATRVFQALRIAVNGELANIERLLDVAPKLLRPGGRFAAISYHSLEDRLVKHTFRALAADGVNFRVMTKRPLTPSADELRENPRARSAKLRILERI